MSFDRLIIISYFDSLKKLITSAKEFIETEKLTILSDNVKLTGYIKGEKITDNYLIREISSKKKEMEQNRLLEYKILKNNMKLNELNENESIIPDLKITEISKNVKEARNQFYQIIADGKKLCEVFPHDHDHCFLHIGFCNCCEKKSCTRCQKICGIQKKQDSYNKMCYNMDQFDDKLNGLQTFQLPLMSMNC
jgi:hypothetical protein